MRVTGGWREIASFGHDDSLGADVQCAWLAEDGSHVWLFDEAGYVHYVRRGASERESRAITASSGALREGRVTFAGRRAPTLWLDSATAGCSTIVELSHRDTPRLRSLEPSGAIVRLPGNNHPVVSTRSARQSTIYGADGTLLATFDDERDGIVVSADEHRCWLWRAGRLLLVDYQRELHCDIALDERPSAQPIDRTRLAIWSARRDVSIVDSRRGTCVPLRTTLAKRIDRELPPYVFAPNGIVGDLRGRLAWQAYEDTAIRVLPMESSGRVVACDERWLVAIERGQVVWFDRDSGEALRSEYSPVESLAFLDRGDVLLSTHRGGLTRYWSLTNRSLITEDDVAPDIEREFAGLRPDARSALFIERSRDTTARIVECSLVGLYVERRWSSDSLRGVRAVAAIDHEAMLVACEPPALPFALIQPGRPARWVIDTRLNRATIALAVQDDEVRLDCYLGERDRSVRYSGRLGAAGEIALERQLPQLDGLVVASSPAGVVVRVSRGRVHLITFDGRARKLAHQESEALSWVLARYTMRSACLSDGNTIGVLDFERGKIARIRVSSTRDVVCSFALSDDGGRLAVGLVTGVVRVFELD